MCVYSQKDSTTLQNWGHTQGQRARSLTQHLHVQCVPDFTSRAEAVYAFLLVIHSGHKHPQTVKCIIKLHETNWHKKRNISSERIEDHANIKHSYSHSYSTVKSTSNVTFEEGPILCLDLNLYKIIIKKKKIIQNIIQVWFWLVEQLSMCSNITAKTLEVPRQCTYITNGKHAIWWNKPTIN